ncbi:hypothetical protein [Alicyclobacillus mengziensis]|uniref:Uncharacterized protein n=1 Tax=Alicyclobacillus mengziensis TaxID=2931921 RepID=A0A9X7W457_9BACL|nr:hypothetical protein [Alicyclobacillus mengziensis]QSO50125.1 hypothetical protein JZ786_24475 [Alicyclobacillus mengziensis]
MQSFEGMVLDGAGSLFCSVGDLFSLRRTLNELADEYSQYGFHVYRNEFHAVIILLPDETLIFSPGKDFSIRRLSVPV